MKPIAYKFGAYVLDLQLGELFRNTGDHTSERIALREQALALLTFLLTHPNKALSKPAVWKDMPKTSRIEQGVAFSAGSFDQALKAVRDALGTDRDFIKTVRANVIRFDCQVEIVYEAAPPLPDQKSQPQKVVPASERLPVESRAAHPIVGADQNSGADPRSQANPDTGTELGGHLSAIPPVGSRGPHSEPTSHQHLFRYFQSIQVVGASVLRVMISPGKFLSQMDEWNPRSLTMRGLGCFAIVMLLLTASDIQTLGGFSLRFTAVHFGEFAFAFLWGTCAFFLGWYLVRAKLPFTKVLILQAFSWTGLAVLVTLVSSVSNLLRIVIWADVRWWVYFKWTHYRMSRDTQVAGSALIKRP